MKYNRYLLLFVPLSTYFFLELFYNSPRLVYVSVVFILSIFFFAIRQFIIEGRSSEKWYNIMTLPACFTVGLVAFSMMIPDISLINLQPFGLTIFRVSVIRLLFVFNLIFVYYYFRAIFITIVKGKDMQESSIPNLSSYGNFLAFYFISSAVYGLQSFLNVSVPILILFLMAAVLLIVNQVMWANQIKDRQRIFYILLICLVLTELAWSISFLTLNYYILGLILAICYYIIIGMVRFYLIGTLDKKIVKLYLIYGFGALLIVLLTARWI